MTKPDLSRRDFHRLAGAALGGMAAGTTATSAAQNAQAGAKRFRLEALTDFVDDALNTTITHKHIRSMMQTLRKMGVRRVSWAYYADGRGGFLVPAGLDPRWRHLADTYQGLGNPLRVAAEAAHEFGIELFAYYKPYETGPAVALPDGSPEARAFGRVRQRGAWLTWFDPFVVDNPHLRIRHRPDDTIADRPNEPIAALRLVKSDDAPTRITAEHLQIWSSKFNYRYKRLDVKFSFRQEVIPFPREVRDINGTLLTKKNAPVRTLTLSGFKLTDPYVLVTTDFAGGPADFANAGTDLLVALDANGKEIPRVFYSGARIYMANRINFRNWGLLFDCGYGRQKATLDAPSASGHQGCVAFCRGRNACLPGALCETEPDVRRFWLSCIAEMLDAGVDGIDFRVENHGTHTEYAEEYGFNDVVLAECRRRGKTDLRTMSKVRGDAYTEFLRAAKRLIAARGKRMRVNLNIDWFRPNPPANRRLAYPANIEFDWRRWVDEGLMDEGILRMFHLPLDTIFGGDAVTKEMIDRCQKKGIPLTVNRYIRPSSPDEFDRVRHDSRFSGFIMYETASYLQFQPDGGCKISNNIAAEISRRMARAQ